MRGKAFVGGALPTTCLNGGRCPPTTGVHYMKKAKVFYICLFTFLAPPTTETRPAPVTRRAAETTRRRTSDARIGSARLSQRTRAVARARSAATSVGTWRSAYCWLTKRGRRSDPTRSAQILSVCNCRWWSVVTGLVAINRLVIGTTIPAIAP